MPTQLDKDITRVSSEKIDDREILITLTEDQKISMKLKGLKKGEVSISIKNLYNQLSGSKETAEPVDTKPKGKEWIHIHDLRSLIMIDGLIDYKSKTVLDKILVDLIKGR